MKLLEAFGRSEFPSRSAVRRRCIIQTMKNRYSLCRHQIKPEGGWPGGASMHNEFILEGSPNTYIVSSQYALGGLGNFHINGQVQGTQLPIEENFLVL